MGMRTKLIVLSLIRQLNAAASSPCQNTSPKKASPATAATASSAAWVLGPKRE